MRKVNPFSERFFSNVVAMKSYPGLFLGFNEFIIDLILYFENLLIGQMWGWIGHTLRKDGKCIARKAI